MAATSLVRFLPYVLFGTFGGVIADRYDRRRVMIVADLARAGVMAVLTVVAASRRAGARGRRVGWMLHGVLLGLPARGPRGDPDPGDRGRPGSREHPDLDGRQCGARARTGDRRDPAGGRLADGGVRGERHHVPRLGRADARDQDLARPLGRAGRGAAALAPRARGRRVRRDPLLADGEGPPRPLARDDGVLRDGDRALRARVRGAVRDRRRWARILVGCDRARRGPRRRDHGARGRAPTSGGDPRVRDRAVADCRSCCLPSCARPAPCTRSS